MARVALRTLTREIEDQIEHGQIDQAIANCRHILTFFPKHVDSYRLLGKAFMEVQRYGDAADVFQRVLSSVPEDFIAHLGMSIIQEDEGNLDEAIWHMERAFEMQPANAAVQSELRRLYGRRDGFEPPKVRLTRGALARMYVKGGLYPQAIAELRSALGEESQRPDLLILLAKAYYLYGQKVEAADTCNSLLSRLPYSLEGNRLLAEILTGSERANEAEIYRQRVQALDPYSAHVSAAAPNLEGVPDGAVTLERLEWRPGQQEGEAPSQPEWAASLGVNVEGLTPEKESLPEWLTSVSGSDQEEHLPKVSETGESTDTHQSQEPTEQPGTLDSAAGLADSWEEAVPGTAGPGVAGLEVGGQEDEEIPEWMQEAGWEVSKGEAGESGPPIEEGEQAQNEELAPAELPDWLRSMAPPGGLETGNDAGGTTESALPMKEGEEPEEALPSGQPGADFLPWLSKNPPGATDSVVTWLENKELEPEELETPDLGQGDLGATEIPEWLRDIEEAGSEAGVLPIESAASSPDFPEWLESSQAEGDAGEVPDWLKEMVEKPEEPAVEAPAGWPLEVGTAAEHTGETDEGESLTEQPVEASGGTAQPTGGEPVGEGELFEQDAAFAWLEGLAARQGIEEGLTSTPDELQETPPEWVEETSEIPAGIEASGEAGLPVETFDLENAEATGEGEAGVPDWLQAGPEPVEAVAPEELEAVVEESPLAAKELPDWLHGLATGAGEGEAVMAWEDKEEANLEQAEPAELPDWLKETAEPPAVEAEAPSGLAGLEEPPVSEGDTKPTRVAKATEISIPSALAGFVASAKAFLHRKKETDGLDETPVEAGAAEKEPIEATLGQQAVEEIQPEAQREELQAAEEPFIEALPQEEQQQAEEIQVAEPELEPPAEAAEPVVEAFVPGIGAAVFHLEEPEVEALEGAATGESGLEGTTETTGQPAEEALSSEWLQDMEKEPDTRWEPQAWNLEETDQAPAEVAMGETGQGEAEETASQPESAGLPEWLRDLEEEPDTRWEPQAWDTEETGQPTAEEPAGKGELFEQDEAFAWLEGLAARQGADEGLLGSPEERQELPPEWVAAEAAATPAEEAPGLPEIEPEIETAAWSVEVFERPAEEIEEQAHVEPVHPGEATELQGELGGETFHEEGELEAETKVELPAEEAAEVVFIEEAGELVEFSVEDVGEVFTGVETEPLSTGGEAASDLLEVTEETIEEEAEAEIPAALEPSLTVEPTPEETPAEEIPELPAWLAGYEQAPAEEESLWTPPDEPGRFEGPTGAGQMVEAEAEELAPVPERLDLNQAALIDLERVPGIGFVRAQALLAYRETHGPLSNIEDLKDVPGFEAETVAQIQDRVMVIAPVGSEEVPVDAHQLALIQARNALAEGDRDKALNFYIRLLKGRALLPDVIQDLHEALYRFPVDISIWQALGDAYARNDEFQQAIDAYTKAEELLR